MYSYQVSRDVNISTYVTPTFFVRLVILAVCVVFGGWGNEDEASLLETASTENVMRKFGVVVFRLGLAREWSRRGNFERPATASIVLAAGKWPVT
jgi:hypothetical protein